MLRTALFSISIVALLACNTGPKPDPTPAPAPAPTPTPAPTTAAPTATGTANEGSLRLGTPIEASAQKVALADVAKAPSTYVGKTFATTGTVTAVCQHMGCWMEIKDDASEAHIKMAGHSFFVPKTASGRKAKILAKLEKVENAGSCEGEGHEGMAANGAGGDKDHPKGTGKGKGCRAEAEAQMGHPLAKLELVAEGVELM
jgi:hypothetical protein